METSITTIDACTREIEITLTNEDLKPHYERAYKEAQKEVEIHGFRKGKVPINIVKQRFARIIEQNALDTIANDEFNRIVRTDNITFVGQPSLRDIRKDPEFITFIIRYEVIPDIELPDYRDLVIRKPIFTVSEEQIQSAINDICLRYATMEPVEVASDNMHIVKVRFTPLDDETLMPIVGAKSEESAFFLRNEEMDDNLRGLLLDSKVGDSLNFVEDAPDENTLPLRFLVTVLEISRVIPAEFTDEIVQKYSEGVLKSVDEMRTDIVKFMERQSADLARSEMEKQVIGQIFEAHSFEVPESLVRRITQTMLDTLRRQLDQPGLEKITIDDIADEFRPRALEIARWQILSDKIAEAEGVEIEDQDLEPYVEILKQKSPKLSDTQLKNFVLQQDGLMSEIFQRKTFDKLFEYAVITEIPEEEYSTEQDIPFHPDDNVRRYFSSQSDDSLILP